MSALPDRTPLFVTLGVYLVGLLGVAVYSFMKGKNAVAGGNKDAEINEHFLASRSFGTAILFLTTFSTIISGYTAFNIPSEVAGIGFIAFRWIQGFVAVIIGYAFIGPRYRRIAIARNWQSPNDIIADRYNCNSLRILGAMAQCLPLILYISVQLISLGDTVFQLSSKQISAEFGVWFLVIFIWICEVIGGFRGVSLTDAIQSGIMLVAFIGLPFLLLALYGGFIGINNFPTCDNAQCLGTGSAAFFNFYPPRGASDVGEGGWNDFIGFGGLFSEANIKVNCPGLLAIPGINATNPSFVPCLTALGTVAAVDGQELFNYVPLGMLSFSIALSVSGLQPHWAQRIISAKSDLVVKKSLMLTSACIMFASIPGLMLGLTQKALFDNNADPEIQDALPIMLGVFYDEGGFPAFFSVVVSVAAIAAFMSTADSAAIGVSNVITIEIFQNWLTPNLSASKKLVLAKLISLTVLITARMLLYLGAEYDILTALNWQIGLGWAVVPTYYLGLFGRDSLSSGYSLLLGMIAHYILLFSLEFGVIENNNNIYLYSGIYCAMLNFAVAIGVNQILPERLRDDANRTGSDAVVEEARERFGGGSIDHLTNDKIKECLSDTVEPIGTRLGQFLIFGAIVIMMFSFPWYGKDGWDSSINPLDSAELIGGMPPWAFNLSIMAGVEFFMLLGAFSLWKTHKMEVELDEMSKEVAAKEVGA